MSPPRLSPRKKVFAAAEEAGNVERNDSRRFATVAASVASTTAAKHGHRVAKTMPGLPSEAAQKQFSSEVSIGHNDKNNENIWHLSDAQTLVPLIKNGFIQRLLLYRIVGRPMIVLEMKDINTLLLIIP